MTSNDFSKTHDNTDDDEQKSKCKKYILFGIIAGLAIILIIVLSVTLSGGDQPMAFINNPLPPAFTPYPNTYYNKYDVSESTND